MSQSITTTKLSVEAEYRALISGINTELVGVDTFALAGQSLTRVDLLARLQSRVDAAEATKAAQAAWHNAVQSEHAVNTEIAPLRTAMKAILVARYGKDSQKLQLFGYPPTMPAKKTVAIKGLGVVRAKATRTARHTMGKKQKKGIKGVVATPPAPAAPGVSQGVTNPAPNTVAPVAPVNSGNPPVPTAPHPATPGNNGSA
jgi:hypothetical protein